MWNWNPSWAWWNNADETAPADEAAEQGETEQDEDE